MTRIAHSERANREQSGLDWRAECRARRSRNARTRTRTVPLDANIGKAFLLSKLDRERREREKEMAHAHVNGVQVMTRDAVPLTVEAVVYYRIANVIAAVTAIEDVEHSKRSLCVATLRNALSALSFKECVCQQQSLVRQTLIVRSRPHYSDLLCTLRVLLGPASLRNPLSPRSPLSLFL